jgi:hypothetical protein
MLGFFQTPNYGHSGSSLGCCNIYKPFICIHVHVLENVPRLGDFLLVVLVAWQQIRA